MSRYAWDKFSTTILVRYVLSYLCGTLYLEPSVSLKRTFAFSVGGLFSLSTLALTWLRLHSLKLQILPITCQLDVKLRMMWWTPIKQLYSPRYHGYFSDSADKNHFSQSSKRLGHASLITPLSWCLEKQDKLRFGMFQHFHFQKKPLKDNRNLNVEITNNYWIRLSIKISSVCIHKAAKQLNLVPRSSQLTVQFSDNYALELTSFFTYRRLLPILVNSGWLSWIIRGILANHKRKNILSE